MTPEWTFLTNHAQLLLAVAQTPDARVRDLAAAVGISERATLTILADLEAAGYLHRNRTGRRTSYTLHSGRPFRHPTAGNHRVDELLAIFTERDESPATPAPVSTRNTRPREQVMRHDAVEPSDAP